MCLETINKIEKYQIKEFNQPRFKTPLSSSELKKFIKESQVVLQYAPCDEYIELLKLTNGYEWNGIVICNAEDFLYDNIDSRKINNDYRKFIIFGGSGSTDTYTFNLEDNTYNISDAFDLNDAFETFYTFDELVKNIYKDLITEFIDSGAY